MIWPRNNFLEVNFDETQNKIRSVRPPEKRVGEKKPLDNVLNGESFLYELLTLGLHNLYIEEACCSLKLLHILLGQSEIVQVARDVLDQGDHGVVGDEGQRGVVVVWIKRVVV